MVRECLSGEVLLARSLLGGTEESLAGLLREVAEGLEAPRSWASSRMGSTLP